MTMIFNHQHYNNLENHIHHALLLILSIHKMKHIHPNIILKTQDMSQNKTKLEWNCNNVILKTQDMSQNKTKLEWNCNIVILKTQDMSQNKTKLEWN